MAMCNIWHASTSLVDASFEESNEYLTSANETGKDDYCFRVKYTCNRTIVYDLIVLEVIIRPKSWG